MAVGLWWSSNARRQVDFTLCGGAPRTGNWIEWWWGATGWIKSRRGEPCVTPTLAEGTPNGVTGCNVISTWPPGEMCHGNGVSRGLNFGGLFTFGFRRVRSSSLPPPHLLPSPSISLPLCSRETDFLWRTLAPLSVAKWNKEGAGIAGAPWFVRAESPTHNLLHALHR